MVLGKIYENYIKNNELFIAFVLLLIFFSASSDRFLTMNNVANILRSTAMTGVLAIGFALIMINGDFDLSFASAVSLINLIGLIIIDKGINVYMVFLLMLGLGIVWELFNSFLVINVQMHAFVATIATWTMCDGFIYWINRGMTFYGQYPEVLTYIGRHTYFNLLPVNALIFGTLAIIFIFLVNKSKFGRYLYAVGSNPDAAKYAGIEVNRYRRISYIIHGACVGLAAIMLASKMGSAPAAAGAGFQMDVITSAFLGATVFKTGLVNVGGSILAIYIAGCYR